MSETLRHVRVNYASDLGKESVREMLASLLAGGCSYEVAAELRLSEQ